MKYELILTLGTKEIEFPVLPEKLEISSPGQNESVSVLGLGEVNRLRQRGLRELSFESFFPAREAPYATGKHTPPRTLIYAIMAYRQKKKPARLRLTGSNLNVNMEVAIEELTYWEAAGEIGDIYYKIKFREYVEYGPRQVTLSSSGQKAKESAAKRPGTPNQPKSHTVVRGDNLWAISKTYYGSGQKYGALYQKNKPVIDQQNKGKRVDKYTIYPGQVLVL